MEFETRAIHDGQEPDPATGAVITPIYQTSTYVQEAVGRHKGYDYSRVANPTRTALETALASLEGASDGIAFASGLGATTTVMHLVDPGQRVVLIADVYGGVYRMTSQVYEPKGYRFTYVPAEEFDRNLASYLDEDVALVWVETPSNPLLNVVDIRRAAEAAHAVGALLAVDNTFASPYLQQPLELGADLVVHSTTKYLGGHSDVIGGFVGTNDEALAEQLFFLQKSLGAVPGPFDAWLVLRGIKTLAVRMRQHCENARAVAAFLDQHPAVERVLYPGLPDHPGHEVARHQMRDFGGMVSFLVSSEEEAMAIAARTKLFQLAESLGGVESLIEHPARMTHAATAEAPFAAPRNLLRLSVGIEAIEDLLADLEAALVASPTADRCVGVREPIDLRYRGFERAVGVYVVETLDGPALFDCGPSSTLPRLREGLRARGLELTDIRHLLLSHIHLDHAGAAGSIVAEHPTLRVWVSEVGARHLVDPSRLEASARRLYGERFDELFGELAAVPEGNISLAAGDVLGWEAFPAPGHASHHVCYLREGTLLAGDACGVRRQPERDVLPVSPPPDIDVELWQATIDEIERRGPERLALTHFGVATDVTRHLALLRAELDRWAGLVAAGVGIEEFARLVRPEALADSVVYDEIAPFDQSWLGLRRYHDKRSAPSSP